MHRIVVVEGYQCLRELYGEVLREAGYEVILAANGRELIQMLRANEPDLVIMDPWDRGLGNSQVMAELQSMKNRPHVVANRFDEYAGDDASLPYADAFVSKSADLSAWTGEIRKHLTHSEDKHRVPERSSSPG